jgi:hypothetical protein
MAARVPLILVVLFSITAAGCPPAGGEGEGEGEAGEGEGEGGEGEGEGEGDAGEGEGEGEGEGDAGGANVMSATGTINGTAFAMSCDFSDPNLSVTRQCQDAGLHFFQCRTTEDGLAGLSGQVFVNVKFDGSAALGETSFDGDSFAGTQLGATGEISALTGATANAVTNTITLTALTPDVHAAGSFTAEWADDGSGVAGDPSFGTVSGTFDIDCP